MKPIAEVVTSLIRAYGGADRVAAQLGGALSKRAVQYHADGERKPSATIEALYRELLVGREASAASGTRSTSKFDSSRPTLDAVIDLVTMCEALVVKAEADPEASYRDRAGAIHALKSTLRDLAKLRGELEPSEASIVRSPAWLRVMAVVYETLNDFPDASKALKKSLEDLQRAGSS